MMESMIYEYVKRVSSRIITSKRVVDFCFAFVYASILLGKQIPAKVLSKGIPLSGTVDCISESLTKVLGKRQLEKSCKQKLMLSVE